MCVVSFIGDYYKDKWEQKPNFPTYPTGTYFPAGPSQQEFDQLKKEVLEMKELLIKAKIYDEKNNEPNCEMEDKIEFLKQVAKLVGIDLDDVFKK